MLPKYRFLIVLLLMTKVLVSLSQQSSSHASTNQNPIQLQPPDEMPVPAQVNTNRSVTFRIWAPRATTVSVDGDFLLFSRTGDSFPMTKSDSGIWSVTLGPLEPDIWRYEFIVDGVSIPGAYIKVPGEMLQFYDQQTGKYGSIHINNYDSKSLGVPRKLYVYTPPDYEKGKQRYPVLYLLHPGGHTESAWLTIGKANAILDNLINEGKAQPMLVVMPFGYPTASLESDQSPDHSTLNHPQFARDLFEDIMPLVEKNYRVSNKPEHRAITGSSMGGVQALTIGLSHLEKFRWFGSFSGLGGLGPNANLEQTFAGFLKSKEKAQKDVRLIWFAAGGMETNVFKRNQQFSELLNRYQIKHTFAPSPQWGHVWQLWRRNLYSFVQFLFKE